MLDRSNLSRFCSRLLVMNISLNVLMSLSPTDFQFFGSVVLSPDKGQEEKGTLLENRGNQELY